MLVRSTDSHVPPSERKANIRLMAQAPAQFILLELLSRGLASFVLKRNSPALFAFDGAFYHLPQDGDWRTLVDTIGYAKLVDALR